MMGALLRRALLTAVRHAAANPRVRAKAVETFHTARPHIAAAARGVAAAARSTPPLRDPVGFARAVRDRVMRPR